MCLEQPVRLKPDHTYSIQHRFEGRNMFYGVNGLAKHTFDDTTIYCLTLVGDYSQVQHGMIQRLKLETV